MKRSATGKVKTQQCIIDAKYVVQAGQGSKVEFIHPTAAGVNNFQITNDVYSVSVQDVLIKVELPAPISSSTNEDFDHIQESFNAYVSV